MTAKLTDEEMIRHCLPANPNQCFEALYNRYVNKVYRRCLSITQDSDKAQDYTHDIFLKAFAKLDNFQERSTFSTWLYSISYNYCMDQIRFAKRLTTVTIQDHDDYDLPDSQEALVREETLQLMKRAMETLSEEETTLLKLKYEEEYSIDELADHYKISPSAAKMRLKRSRDKIQRLYQQQYAN